MAHKIHITGIISLLIAREEFLNVENTLRFQTLCISHWSNFFSSTKVSEYRNFNKVECSVIKEEFFEHSFFNPSSEFIDELLLQH